MSTYIPIFDPKRSDSNQNLTWESFFNGLNPIQPEISTEKQKTDTSDKNSEPENNQDWAPYSNLIDPSWGIQPQPESVNGKLTRSTFRSTLEPIYQKVLAEKGIDSAYIRYLLAQDALESNWGQSYLAEHGFNYGGITVSPKSTGIPYIERGDKDGKGNPITQRFRKFNSAEDYVRYKVALLSGSRYNAFIGDPSGFAERVKAGGYAADPRYVTSLNSMVSKFQRGGVAARQPAEEFLKRYYTDRKDLLHSNSNASWLIPEQWPLNNILRKLSSVKMFELPEYFIHANKPNTLGTYFPDMGHILLRDGTDVDTAVHELAHSTDSPGEKQIKKIIDEMEGKIFSTPMVLDEYRDSDVEIYARFVQWVYDQAKSGKIDLKKRDWTINDVRKLQEKFIKSYNISQDLVTPDGQTHWNDFTVKDNKVVKTDPIVQTATIEKSRVLPNYDTTKDPHDFLTRYNPEFITRVLNEVAVDTTKPKPVYAQNGIKIDKLVRQFIQDTNGQVRYQQQHNKPYPEFWSRLRESQVQSIPDWEGENVNDHVSHLMAWGHYNGKPIIYPEVQKTENGLVDFTRVPYNQDAGFQNAIKTGNYVVAPSDAVADRFTQTYKNYTEYFPGFAKSEETLDFNNQQIKNVYEHLITLGATPTQAAGVTGALFQESGLRHNVTSDAGAKGIAQLLGDNLKEYQTWLNGKQDTWKNQVTWVWDKIHNGVDNWEKYYNDLKTKVEQKQYMSEKERKDWSSMRNSKYRQYPYRRFHSSGYLNADEIAELYTLVFERPSDHEANMPARRRYARQIYDHFNSPDYSLF